MAEHALGLAAFAALLGPAAALVRLRGARRRRSLNRAMHELRRPLQALALGEDGVCGGQLSVALAALASLDREINGGPQPPVRRADVGVLAAAAIDRWRLPAERADRRLKLIWSAGPSTVSCDPEAISRALDNLIANSLEHGRGTITVEGRRARGRLQVRVADSGAAPAIGSRPADPRRGHGSAIVASVAARHGGRFARGEASSVLELPLSR